MLFIGIMALIGYWSNAIKIMNCLVCRSLGKYKRTQFDSESNFSCKFKLIPCKTLVLAINYARDNVRNKVFNIEKYSKCEC